MTSCTGCRTETALGVTVVDRAHQCIRNPQHVITVATDPLGTDGRYQFETSRPAYPLTAVCACGRLITLASRRAMWTHDTDQETSS
jgi:hypothetical protein